jgi:hypothetical protein
MFATVAPVMQAMGPVAFVALALAMLALAGCPSRTDGTARPVGAHPCAKFGDSCEFSPGKLGSCMTRENCTGGTCLFCQSQH